MAKRLEVYKCDKCGMVLEVLHDAPGKPVCCGEIAKLVTENTVDASKEKHVPVVERTSDGVRVTVGSVAHPMEEKHYIEWIEVIADGKVCRQTLNPGDAPEAFFPVKAEDIIVRAYCNLHGLWRS